MTFAIRNDETGQIVETFRPHVSQADAQDMVDRFSAWTGPVGRRTIKHSLVELEAA